MGPLFLLHTLLDEAHDTDLNCDGDEGLHPWDKVLQKHHFRHMVTIQVSSRKSGEAPDLDKETIAGAAPQPDSYMSLSHQPPRILWSSQPSW